MIERDSARTKWMFSSPGIPKTYLTPSFSRQRTARSATPSASVLTEQTLPWVSVNAPALTDIETREDCERLVRAFYGRALTDPFLGFLFTDVAKLDLDAHVPRITSFWETILLGAQ